MMDGMMGGGGLMMLVWFLLGIILIAAIVVGLIYLIRVLSKTGGETSARSSSADSARSILEERYARGEIDRDEFEERRRSLSV